ncbi:MAG: hypothetical protein K9M07_05895 [Simkaniaceae bacterium]|nr:hypothetical protein [Simkaniaceae bacterium]
MNVSSAPSIPFLSPHTVNLVISAYDHWVTKIAIAAFFVMTPVYAAFRSLLKGRLSMAVVNLTLAISLYVVFRGYFSILYPVEQLRKENDRLKAELEELINCAMTLKGSISEHQELVQRQKILTKRQEDAAVRQEDAAVRQEDAAVRQEDAAVRQEDSMLIEARLKDWNLYLVAQARQILSQAESERDGIEHFKQEFKTLEFEKQKQLEELKIIQTAIIGSLAPITSILDHEDSQITEIQRESLSLLLIQAKNLLDRIISMPSRLDRIDFRSRGSYYPEREAPALWGMEA